MNNQHPVIIGSSLTGLLISRSLSLAGIDHILIGGDEPEEKPRLGESLHELASAEFWRWLGPEFYECFCPKNHLCVLNGYFVSLVHTRDPNQPFEPIIYEGPKVTLSKMVMGLMNVDRSKMDKILYHQIKNDPHCRFIYDMAARVIYNKEADTISAIQLSNGETIANPRYVFDGTGPAGVVAKAAGVEKALMGERERLVWTHRYQTETVTTETRPKAWWQYGTTNLKLIEAIDGVNGPAWLIALPDKISIGISVAADRYPPDRIDDDTLVQRIDEAFARRGIDLRSDYPEIKPVQGLHYQHFIRERAYGANWLLPGIAYMQVWFTTLMGVVASTLAARLAPQILETPETTGQLYQNTLKEHLNLHAVFQGVIKGPPFSNINDVREFARQALSVNDHVRSMGWQIVNGDENSNIGLYKFDELKYKLLSLDTLSSQLAFEMLTPIVAPTSPKLCETSLLKEQGAIINANYFTSVPPMMTYFFTHRKQWRILDNLMIQDWEQLQKLNLTDLILSNVNRSEKIGVTTPSEAAEDEIRFTATREALVTVQPNGTKSPFFGVAAGYGDVPLLSRMTAYFGFNQPYYLLQLPSPQIQPLEDLAASYIALIRTIQPHGPYQLGGFNIGGVVAYEMGQQLLAGGDPVSMLALVDTPYPTGNSLPVLSYRRNKSVNRPFRNSYRNSQAAPGVQGVLDRLKPHLPAIVQEVTVGYKTFIEALSDEAYQTNLQITQTYKPATYPGSAVFISAAMSPVRYLGALQRWQAVIPQGLMIHQVSGNMATLLSTPKIQVLAETLKQYLD